MSIRRFTGAASALMLLVPALASTAQLGGGFQGQGNGQGQFNRQNNRQQQRVPPKRNYLPELKVITDALAKKADVKIVVDPTLVILTAPVAPSDGVTVDKAMDQFVAGIRNTSWRKVYLQLSQATVLPPADKLANSVRALDQLEQTGLVLENPTTKQATTFVKNYAITPNFAEELTAGQFTTTPVYVLYSTKLTPATSMSPEERFADLQRQQMEMMMQMSPDEMAQAMQGSMQTFMNMDPNMRQQMMGNMMRAGMQMFQNMPPEQRNQLLQGFGGFPGGPPGAPPRRP